MTRSARRRTPSLLSHGAGIPDDVDEAVMDDYEALWRDRPMYAVRAPRDFLPLFAHLPMKAAHGATCAYSNAGYVLLGLVVEQVAAMPFTEYVQRHVLDACGMVAGGFFAMDRLPGGTAYEYLSMADGGWRMADGGWRTTAYSMVGEEPGVSFSSILRPGPSVPCSLLGTTVDASNAMRSAIAPILDAAWQRVIGPTVTEGVRMRVTLVLAHLEDRGLGRGR